MAAATGRRFDVDQAGWREAALRRESRAHEPRRYGCDSCAAVTKREAQRLPRRGGALAGEAVGGCQDLAWVLGSSPRMTTLFGSLARKTTSFGSMARKRTRRRVMADAERLR